MSSRNGWTYEELMTCAGLAGRLHARILDLQDALDIAIRVFVEDGVASMPGGFDSVEEYLRSVLRGTDPAS